MVQAIININEKANRILNILKAKYGLKDKSQAINLMAEHYEKELLEPELRPEYVEKIRKIEKHGKFTKYSTLKQLRDEIEDA
jgi:hypothetical protein